MLQRNYKTAIVRNAAILTNAYVAGNVLGSGNTNFPESGVYHFNELELYVSYTAGSLDDVLIKFEFSDDNSTYYQETNTTIAGGVATVVTIEHKFTTTGNYRISLPICDRYVKISAKGEGTVTNSSLSLLAILGNS